MRAAPRLVGCIWHGIVYSGFTIEQAAAVARVAPWAWYCTARGGGEVGVERRWGPPPQNFDMRGSS